MSADASNRDLNEISTFWPDVHGSHEPESPAGRREAQERLLKRYQGAIKRYMTAAVRDPEQADELFQKFAVRFVQGDFHRADPMRGRFRDYLKSALFHLVDDHRRAARRFPGSLPPNAPEPCVDAPPSAEDDARFLACWRADLLARAWAALDEHERRTARPLSSILRYFTQHPEVRSAQVAAMYSARFGTEISDGWVRRILHQARRLLQDAVMHEVGRTLDAPTLANIEEELIDLGLHSYFAGALSRRRGEES
ncbi:MAG: polymerase sigma factor, sigma-70 family [Planctomycetota bacterium]|nr:polymerase sigma factor, sigma-70 family [Planctomycetota bacterium]